jgi:hypothetical protein
MINLKPNEASEQFMDFTAQDVVILTGGQYYTLTFVGSMKQATYSFTPRIVENNSRYTRLGVFTDTDDTANGKIDLTERGQFLYELYLTDGVTPILIEEGSLHVETGDDNSNYSPSTTNKVYYVR